MREKVYFPRKLSKFFVIRARFLNLLIFKSDSTHLSNSLDLLKIAHEKTLYNKPQRFYNLIIFLLF